MTRSEVGELCRQMREAQGLSMDELASAIGARNRQYIHLVESGRAGAEAIARVMRHFGMEVEERLLVRKA